MTSNEDTYYQMYTYWHDHPQIYPQHSSASLPYSPLSPHHAHPPNVEPYCHQTRHHTPTFNNHSNSLPTNEKHASQSHDVYHRENTPPTASSCTKPWIPYDPLKMELDTVFYAKDNNCPRQGLEHNGKGQHGTQSHQPGTLTNQTAVAEGSAYNMVQKGPMVYAPSATTKLLSGLQEHSHPCLPGETRYLQYRNSQTDPVLGTAQDPVNTPSSSLAQAFYNERTCMTCPNPEQSYTVEPPKQPSMAALAATNGTSSRLPEPSQVSSNDYTPVCNLPRGTQDAPFEIFSSPEPETEAKRRKTANFSQAACHKLRETLNPTELTDYDGCPREEIMKVLAKSTDVKLRKTWYYAVAIGRNPGIYRDWSTVKELVEGFSGAKYKKFKTEEEALTYIERCGGSVQKLSMSPVDERHAPRVPGYEQYSCSMQATQSIAPNSCDSGYSSFGITSELVSSGISSQQQIESPFVSTGPRAADMDDDFVPLDDNPKLVPEQQHVVDLILQGHNVFYTGSAGCGKSTILKAFVSQLKQQGKKVSIVAPTNLAALNVGGQTTWNFAGWTPNSMSFSIDQLMQNARGRQVWDRFDKTDVLVIDEISMVENLQFERLNLIMKASRGTETNDSPFGGVQLIVTGDFYQLAPVKPFQRCMCGWELEKDNKNNPKEYKCENKACREHTFYDIDKWAFRSKAWKECNFKHVNLTQVHRQSDMMFKSILNRIRIDGKILKPHAHVLLNHTSETEGAIMLFARRFDVDRVNNENINKIPSPPRAYKCLDDFQWPENHRGDKSLEKNTFRMPDGGLVVLKEHRFEPRVQLKQGQRVVLQANIDPAFGLVNGAQGKIIEFEPYKEENLPKVLTKKGENGGLRGEYAGYRQVQIESFGDANGRQPWPVVEFTNGIKKTIFADCTVNIIGNEAPHCLLSRTQIPLVAGYAITVHKSQGMTLDRVTVDLARAFEPSQVYVALSRARSLKGLTVTALPRFDLGGSNEQVKEFMESFIQAKKLAT